MEDDPCPRCDDTGYQEFASGGIWTGENITVRREFCDCPCGQDARDQENRTGLHLGPDGALTEAEALELDDIPASLERHHDLFYRDLMFGRIGVTYRGLLNDQTTRPPNA